MEPSSGTRASLVVRLSNARDDVAWGEFLDLYEPLILRLMRNSGLQDSDALDLCQQVLAAVARDVSSWKPDGESASFRRWLFRIARNSVIKFLVKERKRIRGIGGTDGQIRLETHPDNEASLSAEFEKECREQTLIWAREQIRAEFQDSTWAAFWRTCVEGRSPTEVAAELKMKIGNVYVARSRVIARLRQKVQEVEAEVR